MEAIISIRLHWVLADPARERAVDPLGMGSQADKIADKLLPDLSVNTVRARYLSFLCWAVQKSKNANNPLVAIHRLEAQHALEEVLHHRDELKDLIDDEQVSSCPRIIGIRNGRQYLDSHDWKAPAYPERLYKNTAFAMYRPLMRALKILRTSRRPTLENDGERLATVFSQHRGLKPRCMSDISKKEQTYINGLLGFDYRQSELSEKALRRRTTYEVLRRHLEKKADSSKILEYYSRIGVRPSETAMSLHTAYVWELLSLGLSLSFSALLAEKKVTPVARGLLKALKRRHCCPNLSTFAIDDTSDSHYDNIVSLLRGALRHQPGKLGLDPVPIGMAEILIVKKDPYGYIQRLVDRHCIVKQGDAWIELTGNKVRDRMPNKSLPFRVEPRTYRIDAFKQLLRDLGKIN